MCTKTNFVLTDEHLCSCSKLSLGVSWRSNLFIPKNMICQVFLGMMKLVKFDENVVSAAW